MIQKKHWSILLILTLFGPSLFGQDIDIEKRVGFNEVPSKSLNFTQSIFSSQKIKWYLEKNDSILLFEAKTKHKKHRYSVEFDTLGNIIDVEKIIKYKSLSTTTKKKIHHAIISEFKTYKVQKTQIQWISSDEETLTELIQFGFSNKFYVENFEVTIKGKKESIPMYYRILINNSGKIIQIIELERRSVDNLDF